MRSLLRLFPFLLLGTLWAAEPVRYSDFGAAGDGKTDDFDALIAAHQHANTHGLPVRADDGVTYYLGKPAKTIPIQTNTVFGKARFLIDDRDLADHRKHVFEITSRLAPMKMEGLATLKRGQRELPVPPARACLVSVTDESVKRFIRRGKNQNSGFSQTDSFLVRGDGTIDPKTPMIWDFRKISSIKAYPMDEETLTVSGGIFTTIANVRKGISYHARGILIRRSRVVIEELRHLVTGEGKDGPPYRGFLSVSNCSNVVILDTIVTGRKTYYKAANTTGMVPMGSCGISINHSLNVTLQGVTQTNDMMDRTYWGIIGTNFCKNLTYDECKLSRFDAHMGVKLTGFGEFLIANTTVHGGNLITLHPDYGSTWTGSITIRNCTFVPSRHNPGILGGSNDGQHDFGYPCLMPEQLTIDGLKIKDAKLGKKHRQVFLFDDFNPSFKDAEYQQEHPYQTTRSVSIRGVITEAGTPVEISRNRFMLRDVEVNR